MMSPILPPVSMSIAITRQYSVMTAWIVVTVVSNSSTSALIETFMTDWSRTMMNWAPASATSAHFAFTLSSSCLAFAGSVARYLPGRVRGPLLAAPGRRRGPPRRLLLRMGGGARPQAVVN